MDTDKPLTEAGITTWSELVASDRFTIPRNEMAALPHIDVRTVTRGIEDGDIPARRIGRQWFIPRAAVVEMFGGAA